jgi:hypothetical protein
MGYFARVLADPIRWLLLALGGALGALLYLVLTSINL